MSQMAQDINSSDGIVEKKDNINNDGMKSHAIIANLNQNIMIYDLYAFSVGQIYLIVRILEQQKVNSKVLVTEWTILLLTFKLQVRDTI